MRIIYLTTLIYPSTYANRLQVMKMSQAFSRASEFTLVVGEMRKPQKEIATMYGLKHNFTIQTAGPFTTRPRALLAAFALKKIVDASPADTVFYIREVMPAFYLTLISPKFRQRFFFEAHSFVRYHKFIYNRIFKFAKGVVITSEQKAQAFKDLFNISPDRLLVRGNAIDSEIFQQMPEKVASRTELGLPLDKKIITLVGKQTAERSIQSFIESVALASDSAYFISVGGSKAEIEQWQNIKGYNNVHFIPQVPHGDVAKYMASSDVIAVLLSKAFPELAKFASPLKAAEGLASGIPTIFSDLPAMREIADGSMTTFVASDDAADLWAKISYVLDHYPEAQSKATHARERIFKKNWNQRALDIIEFMQAHLNKTS